MSVSTTAGLDLGPATDASDPLESANDGVPLFQTQRGPGIPGIRIHGCGRCTSDAIFVGNMPGAAGPERQVPLAVAIGGGKPGVRGLLVCATNEARGQKPDSGLVSRSDASWPRPHRNHPIHASWKRSAKKLRRPAPLHTWVKLPTALRVWSLARLLLSPALVWPLPVRPVHPVCTADRRELSQGSPRSALR